jgi:hypothetical protein
MKSAVYSNSGYTIMTTPLIPTFEDIRKILNFWFDQENKWFYFETAPLKVASNTEIDEDQEPFVATATIGHRRETVDYSQDRIVGLIFDVISYPPSLLLHDATIYSVQPDFSQGTKTIKKVEKREIYGLVFSQITYYEPIKDIKVFLQGDPRVSEQEE